ALRCSCHSRAAQKARVNGKPRQFTSRSRRLVCNGMRLTALNPADELCAARFSRPVTAQGIEFIALVPDGYNGTNLHNYGYVELSKDQEINGQSCKKGDMAHYTTPGVSFREPLAPEKWKFEGCGNDEKPIRLTAVPPPPKPGFWDAFFDALLPHPGGFYCC
ncbi:hypothetical protein, partial [Burkholderia ubonensis]|uniref:hypothetical protein n=1 Tax=Burkholderia ubonensis TaxID=101571 RepID=UPI001E38D42F